MPNIFQVIPFIFIVAGTDANCFIKEPEKAKIMKEVINKSETLISFNQEMIDNLKYYLNDFNYDIIPQSVACEELNLDKENEIKELIFKKLNISLEKKIILFPSGMRKIKDPLFVLDELCEFLSVNEKYVCILVGSIYEENLYLEIKEKTKNIDNFIISTSLEHKDFLKLLKESSIVINSSICEGMSNVILEAMSLGVPVIARKNQGNLKLIRDNFNGFIFEDKDEFRNKFKLLLDNDNSCNNKIRQQFIENGKNIINENFSIENEISNYCRILRNVLSKYYFRYNNYNLFFSKDTHPFSVENNKIFESSKIDLSKKLNFETFKETNEINILDVGCGAGIFSFIFLLINFFNDSDKFNNNHEKTENINLNLFLSDIDRNSIMSSFFNFNKYKELFRNHFKKINEKIYKINLNLIKLSVDNLISKFKEKKDYYYNKFDYILANLPQTPSQDLIRRDKHGGNLGVNLYIDLFKDLRIIVSENSEKNTKNTQIYILHISLSNPQLLNDCLQDLYYKSEIIYEQKRKLNPNSLGVFSKTLKDYLLHLKEKGQSEFEIIDENNEWIYRVWAKKIILHPINK